MTSNEALQIHSAVRGGWEQDISCIWWWGALAAVDVSNSTNNILISPH